jgi:hypothetical protein
LLAAVSEGEEPVVTLTDGAVGDMPVFRNLIQLYWYDMSAMQGRDLDAHGFYDYPLPRSLLDA